MVTLPFEPKKPEKNDTLCVKLKCDEVDDYKVIYEIAEKNKCTNISSFSSWENKRKFTNVIVKFKNRTDKKSFLEDVNELI